MCQNIFQITYLQSLGWMKIITNLMTYDKSNYKANLNLQVYYQYSLTRCLLLQAAKEGKSHSASPAKENWEGEGEEGEGGGEDGEEVEEIEKG